MKNHAILIALAGALVYGSIDAQAATDTSDNISNYLVDMSSGQVSAGSLVGLSGSAITDVQSSQDLILAINPFSTGSSKSGYGLAITPARTNILPVKGSDYKEYSLSRLWGGTTISYAENAATIAGATYQKSAASVDAIYYWNKDDDPIVKAAILFGKGDTGECRERKAKNAELADFIDKNDMNDDRNKLTVEKLRQAAVDAWDRCLKSEANKAKWNATKISFSVGTGWIKPDATSGPSHSLGNTFTASGIFELGSDSAAYVLLRRTIDDVDLTTLAGTPTFSSSNLAAIRFTQGSANNGDLRWLIEFSSADNSTVTASNNLFKSAIGVDKKISPGIWLEFRVGRNRTIDGTDTQTTSLLNLKWAPSSTLFK